jgi:hypothetical protein
MATKTGTVATVGKTVGGRCSGCALPRDVPIDYGSIGNQVVFGSRGGIVAAWAWRVPGPQGENERDRHFLVRLS